MKLPRDIYAIQHRKTKRMYIGSSANPEKRIKGHLWQLRSGKHTNKEMLKDFQEFGEDYEFFILDTIENFSDRHLEYDYQEKYKTKEIEHGYNYKDQGGSAEKIEFSNKMPEDIT